MLTELRRARDTRPDAIAVRSSAPGGEWIDTTWAELRGAAEAVAAGARARGLVDGPPVVLVVDGTAASVATVLGLVEAGVDLVLLEERTSYLSDRHSPLSVLGSATLIGPATTVAAGYATRLGYADLRAPARPAGPAPARPSRILQLTSGSTGEPRIARQTLPNVLQGAYAYRDLFGITESDVVLVPVPLPHSYGLAGMFVALITGARLVTLPRFGIRALLAALEDDVTVMLGTPMVYRLLAPVLAVRGRPARLRTALSAGGPLAAELADAAAAAVGTRVRQIYGITEAGLVACVPRSVTAWPPGSAGFAAPGVELRIEPVPGEAAEPGDPPSAGRTGRLFVRTPALFEGYVGGSRPHLTGDGCYDTGDVVHLDPDGHLTVLGRKESFINVGGRKVNPRRLERVLAGHRAVREVFVFGVERPDHEQEIHAAVVLDSRTHLDEVLAYCRASALMPYEVPRHVHVLDRLPRTGMGKVDRQEVLAATQRPVRPSTTRF